LKRLKENIVTSGKKPAIAITMGDPCGIGPEVVVKAMADSQVYATCRPVVVGNVFAMEQAVALTGLPVKIKEVDDATIAGTDSGVIEVVDIHNLNPEDITVGEINPTCGKAAMEWVTKAGQLALAGVVDALATAPLNKEAASLAGYKSIGHMELLQELSKSELVAHAHGQEFTSGAPQHPPIPKSRLRFGQERPDFGIPATHAREFRQLWI